MDPLTHLLDGPRAHRAFALRMVMTPPWSVDVRDEAPLTVIAVTSGAAVLVDEDGSHVIERGGVALVRGPDSYRVADRGDRVADITILPGQECRAADGSDVQFEMMRGTRTWGNSSSAESETTMVIGTYETAAEVGSVVAAALPRLVLLPPGAIDPALVRLIDEEVTDDSPGQGSVVDRLLDVLLVRATRAWAAQGTTGPGWLAAGEDPLIARALHLLHETPAAAWTLDVLAERVNISRSGLAARFRTVVGEPPMTYLTGWRMLLAGELLEDPTLTTASIAGRVGYGSAFAFSTAFKRRYGVSPSSYRARGRDPRG